LSPTHPTLHVDSYRVEHQFVLEAGDERRQEFAIGVARWLTTSRTTSWSSQNPHQAIDRMTNVATPARR
jgi:hypothetical protein